MAEKPHARRDNTAPELSDSFTPATVDELLRAIGAHLTEAGLNSAVVTKALTEQLAAAPSSHDLEGAGNLPRLNRNSIPTELKQDDADLLLSGLKALEGYADSSGLWTDLNPVSSPGEREVHGGGSTGTHARLVQRELGSSEVNLSRKWDPSTANVDPLAPDVLIVGGAAAGLAAAACLLQHGIENVVVIEKGSRPGDNWKRRYDRLHLHDIIDECHLPYMPMPDTFPTFPTRVQYGNYLHGYSIAMGINVRQNSIVTQATQGPDGGWEVDVLDESESPQTLRYRPRVVIAATGLFPQTQPNLVGQGLPGVSDYNGEVLHSVDYHNGARFHGKQVLLVGFGNSANDITCDLWEEGADTTVLSRSPVSLVPRSLWQFIETLSYRAHWLRRLIAQRVAGARDEIEPWRECFSVDPVEATHEVEALMKVVDSVAKFVSKKEFAEIETKGVILSEVGPIECLAVHGEAPVIDVGAARLIMRDQVAVRTSPLVGFTQTGVQFADGSTEDYSAVVFATGFSMASGHYDWLDRPLADAIGSGSESMGEGRQPFAAETPGVPGLFTFYGRLQMLREGGPLLAARVAAHLQQEKL